MEKRKAVVIIRKVKNGWTVTHEGQVWVAETVLDVERIVSGIVLGIYDEGYEGEKTE